MDKDKLIIRNKLALLLNTAIAAYGAILSTGMVDYHMLNKLLKSLDTFNLLAIEYGIDREQLKKVISRTVKDESRYILLSESEYETRVQENRINNSNVVPMFRG